MRVAICLTCLAVGTAALGAGVPPAAAVPPTTVITRPDIEPLILTVGPTLLLRWEGSDPEAPSGEPASYLYKLLRLDTLDPPLPIVAVASPDILYAQGDSMWTPADSLELLLQLETPGSYVFGVRAVGETGEEETALEFGRNAFKFQALATGGYPHLVIREPVIGRFPASAAFRGTSTVVETEVPAGLELHFEISCDASESGATCVDWRWGLDLADLDLNLGWSAWISDTSLLPPLRFPGNSVYADHYLYVQLRDDMGTVTTGTLAMHIVDFPLDRDILWVDDVLDGTYPSDAQHDQFWLDRLDAYSAREEEQGRPALLIDSWAVHGVDDRGNNQPMAPSLTSLGRYRTVVWENAGSGFQGRTALLLGTVLAPNLGAYLSAGGQMWLGGSLTAAATASPNGVNGNFAYPKDLATTPANFLNKYMKVRTTRLDRSTQLYSTDLKDSFLAALPAPGGPYPRMDLDPGKLNPIARNYGGIVNCEAIFDPILVNGMPGFRGELDSVYLYGASGYLFDPQDIQPSAFHNKPCGLRWSDPDPAPLHGRTQWFGFPLYYLENGQAQETLNRSLDWFRGIEIPVAVQLASFTAQWRDGNAVLDWDVASATDHAGFFVHREGAGGIRIRLHDTLLSGLKHYEFMDETAPRDGGIYWLAEVSRAGVTTWHGPRSLTPYATPRVLTLAAAPNPFRSATEIAYNLPERGPVVLTVFDIQGRRVATLVDGVEDAGEHSVGWDGRAEDGTLAASGLYFLHLRVGSDTRVQKAILAR